MNTQRTTPFAMRIVDEMSSEEHKRFLDPIDVVIWDELPGRGRIVIVCWSESWAVGFGAMGAKERPETMAQFFCSCDTGYLVGKLHNGRPSVAAERYLTRIVLRVQEALRSEGVV